MQFDQNKAVPRPKFKRMSCILSQSNTVYSNTSLLSPCQQPMTDKKNPHKSQLRQAKVSAQTAGKECPRNI